MKRWIAGILAVGLLGTLVLTSPKPAEAWSGHGHGNFWGAFGVGAVTGLVVGGLFAPRVYAAPPVVYQPAPVYYAPAPVCRNYWVNGYWYGPNWIAGHWEQACR